MPRKSCEFRILVPGFEPRAEVVPIGKVGFNSAGSPGIGLVPRNVDVHVWLMRVGSVLGLDLAFVVEYITGARCPIRLDPVIGKHEVLGLIVFC